MTRAVDVSRVLPELDERSRTIFRLLVERYLDGGAPVGSRTLSKGLEKSPLKRALSPASVRNVMQDLEEMGLLAAPHVSAGRIPTETGLRLFVDSLLEINAPSDEDRQAIRRTLGGRDRADEALLDEASSLLSALSGCASIVFAPKRNEPIRQVDFVRLGKDRALAVFVFADGSVENRLFVPPSGTDESALREAANFLNAAVRGRTLAEARHEIEARLETAKSALNNRAQSLINMGHAYWADRDSTAASQLIIRGSAHLLDDATTKEDLAVIQALFEDIERETELVRLLQHTIEGEGVRIFIGSESELFSLTCSSLVVSPYMDAERKLLGVIGVVGPTRLNYGRIVPVVEYTARIVGELINGMRFSDKDIGA